MPILALALVVVQIICAVHAVRTGKDPIWLWIIILVPGIGVAVYALTQLGPDAASSRTARRAGRSLLRAVDPQRELRKRMELLEISDTVENRIGLADECVEAGMHAEAIELLEHALSGIHATDPGIMERLAWAQFHHGQPARTVETLDRLIEANSSYRSPDGHLLYARSLEALGRVEAARREYEALYSGFPGEEARVRYALFLRHLGEHGRAKALLEECLTRARRAPSHYRRKEREWIRAAERELQAAA